VCLLCVCERERERPVKSARRCTLPVRENQSNIFPSACTAIFQKNDSDARCGRRVILGIQIYVAGIYVDCFEGRH